MKCALLDAMWNVLCTICTVAHTIHIFATQARMWNICAMHSCPVCTLELECGVQGRPSARWWWKWSRGADGRWCQQFCCCSAALLHRCYYALLSSALVPAARCASQGWTYKPTTCSTWSVLCSCVSTTAYIYIYNAICTNLPVLTHTHWYRYRPRVRLRIQGLHLLQQISIGSCTHSETKIWILGSVQYEIVHLLLSHHIWHAGQSKIFVCWYLIADTNAVIAVENWNIIKTFSSTVLSMYSWHFQCDLPKFCWEHHSDFVCKLYLSLSWEMQAWCDACQGQRGGLLVNMALGSGWVQLQSYVVRSRCSNVVMPCAKGSRSSRRLLVG